MEDDGPDDQSEEEAGLKDRIVDILDFTAYDADEVQDSIAIDTGISASLDSSTKKKKKATLDDFVIMHVIGKGAYGKVFLVRRKGSSSSNDLFAMKVLRKASIVLHNKDTEHTQNERSILEAVRHPFIVKLYYAFQTPEKLFLILSFASGGELFTYLAKVIWKSLKS